MYQGGDYSRVHIFENALTARAGDFAGTYLAVRDLQEIIRLEPASIRPRTIFSLKRVLENPEFSNETQAFFLYREAAAALAFIVMHSDQSLAGQAFSALKDVLGKVTGVARRATAEAVGSLPLTVKGPRTVKECTKEIPKIKWDEILGECGIAADLPVSVAGRCLVVDLKRDSTILVVKLACREHSAVDMHAEVMWMRSLGRAGHEFPRRFDVPLPLKICGAYLLSLMDLPVKLPERLSFHHDRYAICFLAHADYFAYPNGSGPQRRLSPDMFMELMLRNAWLFGRLASLGIVHSAPIPLFHNRIQAHRRQDHGLYEWWRGGRLDRWLASCTYPNFGASGIRDFEHLIAFNGSPRELYRHIGAQILGLLLVAGSYFRNAEPVRVGLDTQRNPVDARDLFDGDLLKLVVEGVFLHYYQAFAGLEFDRSTSFDFDVDNLCCRMIEEMGVDRHMEEILRVVDQDRMSDEQLREFLMERGYSEERAAQFKKGVEDITLITGPHLGGFNDRISLPELIDSVGAISALCIAGRCLAQRAQAPSHGPAKAPDSNPG